MFKTNKCNRMFNKKNEHSNLREQMYTYIYEYIPYFKNKSAKQLNDVF